MDNSLQISAFILDKFIERAANRVYSQTIEKCKQKYTLYHTMEFLHHLHLLGFPTRDLGACTEPANQEPPFNKVDALAGERVEVKKDIDVHKIRDKIVPEQNGKRTRSRFSLGRISKMTDKRIKKPNQSITVPIVNKSQNEIPKSEQTDEVDRTIERLRVEFLAREKKRRKDEAEIVQKTSVTRNKTADSRLRDMGKKYKDYSMDFSGVVVPVVPFPVKKCKEAHPSITAKVLEDSVVDTSVNYSGFLADKNAKDSLQTAEQINTQESNMENAEDKTKVEPEDYHVADLSRIEPSFGVTVKGNEGIKKGPSVMEDPKLMARTGFNFHKGGLGRSEKKAELRRVIIAQERGKGKTGPNKRESYENPDISAINPESILLVRQAPDIATFYNGKASTKANKTFIGSLPTNAVAYAKYKRGLLNSDKKNGKVIVQKEVLAKNLQFVEENAITRIKTASGRNESTIYRRSSVERKTRERSSPISSHSKYRMAPPPIGKTIGHGIISKKS